MKKLLVVLVLFSGLAAKSQTGVATNQKEIIVVKEMTFDFGKIQQGRPVTHFFEITNNGTEPLVLENVVASCGCTTPEWNKAPILPGASTKIKVGYNAAAEGPFDKTVTIIYNGGMSKVLNIKGLVYKAPPSSAPANTVVASIKTGN
ncbi:MAG: DUF1573 domain-containing protein [Chitinophagaceae bacterium]|uniref:DUF1573 domain-containing protein n=1 Tax=unclassified Paraflavitalea TaxID=2798305 RepID=UPI003D343D39|nr:DUF1573 domain-containing protein [Chitinophagaceae bacterium]